MTARIFDRDLNCSRKKRLRRWMLWQKQEEGGFLNHGTCFGLQFDPERYRHMQQQPVANNDVVRLDVVERCLV